MEVCLIKAKVTRMFEAVCEFIISEAGVADKISFSITFKNHYFLTIRLREGLSKTSIRPLYNN